MISCFRLQFSAFAYILKNVFPLSPFIISQIHAKSPETISDLLIFEQNATFLRFYETFSTLHNLETFRLLWDSSLNRQVYQYQTSFTQALFKRIPHLKRLTSTYQSSFSSGLNSFSLDREIKEHNLPQFFESVAHLGNTLQELEIGNEDIIYSKFDLSALRNKFPRLAVLKFTGSLLEKIDSDIEPVGSILEQLVSLGDSLTSIQLRMTTKNVVKLLLSFLQDAYLRNQPSKIKIELEIKSLNYAKLQDSGCDFDDVISDIQREGGYERIRGVDLKLYIGATSEKMREFFRVYEKRFDGFQVHPANSWI